MFKNKLRGLALGLSLLSISAGNLTAQINVLWYGVDASYNAKITTLAASAPGYDPLSNGSLSWNLTFWSASDPTPTFSNYDVLVVGSSDQGFFGNFNDSRLLGAKTQIEAARGNRTFLSGQDADWHYINSPGAVNNGPKGFLINAVNWAGSGTGLGVVALADGYYGSQPGWMTDVNSFLRAELLGNVIYDQEESVNIPGAMSSFPINEGLTSGGLSNWGISAHQQFSASTPGYVAINTAGVHPGYAVTIVTAGEAGGGTTGGTVPDGANTILLVSASFVLLRFFRNRRA